MRRTRRDPLGRALALNIAALSLFGVACLMSLMTVSTAGMQGRRPPNTRSVRFAVPPPTPDLTGEVSAMSTAVGQLADAVAAMLRRQEQDDVIKSLRRF